MTSQDFNRAFKVADSNADLSNVDDSVLSGIATKDAKPVVATVKQVARTMRDHRMFNGDWDTDGLTELKGVFRRKVTMVG